jgi:hypothetical protein
MFMADIVEKIKLARDSRKPEDIPTLFQQADVETTFEMMDPTGRGYITVAQYQEGMAVPW